MSLSVSDFAAALGTLRPQLHSTLQHRYPCQPEDAEDLVEDAITDALEKLANYQPEHGSLLNWLKGFLIIRIMRERDRAANCPQTVPIDLVADLPEPPPTVLPREVLLAKIATLPREQAELVCGWLDGYSQSDLAGIFRIHRNTVANRLHLAFATLGTDPDADRLTYSLSLFDKCRRQPIYRKPPGSSARWKRSNPRDVNITLRGNTEDRSRSDRRIRALQSQPRKVAP